MIALRTPRRAWLALLAVCLLSGSGLACGGDDTSAADVSDADGASSSEPEEMFDADLAQVCRDTGQPRSAAYAPGPGVHPVHGLRSDDGVTFTSSYLTLPEEWSMVWPDLDRAELVVCAERVSATAGRVCDGYSNEESGATWSVQLHDVSYAYSVRVARTAEVLGDTTFAVPGGACPMLTSFSEDSPNPQPYYPDVPPGEVELFLRTFVTGS